MHRNSRWPIKRLGRDAWIAVSVALALGCGAGVARAQNPVAPAACQLPTQKMGSQEQTAWQLFVAMNCVVKTPQGPKLTWETWTEQTCWLNPSSPGCNGATDRKRFTQAASMLAVRGKLKLPAGGGGLAGCSPMLTRSEERV